MASNCWIGPRTEKTHWPSLSPPVGRPRRTRFALRRQTDVVFSDGEHVGIPLAMAMRVLRIRTPHLLIGHHLDTPAKRLVFRWLKPNRRMDRILVHSPNQLVPAHEELAALIPLLRVVPYGIDTDFWSPQPVPEEEGLVVSKQREHRDSRQSPSRLSERGPLVHR